MKDIRDLSVEEKLGQLLIIGFNEPVLTDEIRTMIHDYKFGNFILFSRNIKSLQQLEKLTRDLHDVVMREIGIMPFIAIDQEGGMVVKIMNKATFYPGSMTLAATKVENANIIGHMMGKHLMSLGINVNFAPSLDINNNPKNPIIGIRSYSDNPNIVSQFGVNLIKGMQDEDLIATAKHFPGHGDVEIDSHLSLPILPYDKKRLYDMELKPFKEAINNGVKNIMCAHIIFQKVDEENPATLSKNIIQGILRKELNYDGLITSDCMEMKAISEGITTPVGVIKGLSAGIDLACVCHTKERQINSINMIKQAIQDHLITLEEINSKIERILKYKTQVYSAMNKVFFNSKGSLDIFNDNHQAKIIQSIVDSSLTYVRRKKLELKGKIILYGCKTSISNACEDIADNTSIIEFVSKEIPSVYTQEYKMNEYSEELIKKAKEYDTIIFISFNAFTEPLQAKMINELNQSCSNFYVISIRNPYDYLSLDENINYYTLYECTPNSLRSLIKFLKGEINAVGKLPIVLTRHSYQKIC
ncbi:glycoside hydrolase family 3 protein [Neocallimastix lanati (nom. inval.)]|nr:glycoside hydrolase family 3 protein [Neocallimastix sp. JGI-2020a]